MHFAPAMSLSETLRDFPQLIAQFHEAAAHRTEPLDPSLGLQLEAWRGHLAQLMRDQEAWSSLAMGSMVVTPAQRLEQVARWQELVERAQEEGKGLRRLEALLAEGLELGAQTEASMAAWGKLLVQWRAIIAETVRILQLGVALFDGPNVPDDVRKQARELREDTAMAEVFRRHDFLFRLLA